MSVMIMAGKFSDSGHPLGDFLAGIGKRLDDARVGPLDGATTFVGLYFLLQALALPLVSYLANTGVNIDEAEQLIYLPHFWMGYGSSQPPLYSWLNAIGAQLFGTTILSLKIVKYLVFFLGTASLAMAMRRLGYPRRTAAAAMLGLFILPGIAWEMQRALTHSVAAFAFSALMLLALVVLFEKRTPTSYILFGLASGLALLAKYNNVLILAALVAGGLSIPAYRSAILNRRFLFSVGTALLVVMPTALWSLEHQGALLAHASKFRIGDSGGGALVARLNGLWKLTTASLSFSMVPLGLLALALSAERLPIRLWRQEASPQAKFIGRTMLFGLAIAALLILASGSATVRGRWLLPLLFLLPAYAAMRIEEFGAKGQRIEYLLAGIGAALAAAILPFVLYVQAFGGYGLSSTTRLDYPAFYQLLKTDGSPSTVVGDGQWVGNFRLVNRNLVILTPQTPYFGRLMEAPAVAVWLGADPAPRSLMTKIGKAGYAVDGDIRQLSVPEHLSRKGSRKVSFVHLKKSLDAPAADADIPDAEPSGSDGD